jgi:hypothetical protein
VKKNGLSAAVVDHALADGDTRSICRYLKRRRVPFVTYSGFQNPDLGNCSGVYIAKPNPPEVVVETIAELLGFTVPRGRVQGARCVFDAVD